MTVEVLARATQISDAFGELAREVARSVVLVRGSMGSSGSGVIWDRPGLVITNHHVVPGTHAELTVSGGRCLESQRAPIPQWLHGRGRGRPPAVGVAIH